jgi:hypothetical protein
MNAAVDEKSSDRSLSSFFHFSIYQRFSKDRGDRTAFMFILEKHDRNHFDVLQLVLYSELYL